MSQFGTLKSHHTPLSCSDCLVLATTASSSAITSSTSTSTSQSSTSISTSTSSPSRVSSTIYISILPATTMLTSTKSAMPSSSGSKLSGNAVAPTNPTLSAAGVAQSSFSLPKEPSSQTKREHVIILVLISVIVIFLIFFFAFYLFRRSRQLSRKKQQELEEGRNEVTEARAFWPVDGSLKEGYHSTRSFQLLSPGMLQPPPPTASNGAHPLYHAGLKRSRTLPLTRPVQYPLGRPAMSYPHVANGQTTELQPSSSPFSISSYLKPEPKPMTPLTTMQTRRPSTPEPLHAAEPFRRTGSPNSYVGRQIHSIWSISATSLAPSSPSLYSPPSPTTHPAPDSLRPRPMARGSSPVLYSPYRSPSPEHTAVEAGTCPMFALDRDDSPTLANALPSFRLVGDSPSTAIIVSTEPEYTSPSSPRRSPRSPTLPLPRSPKSPRSPKAPVPKCDSPDCSLQSSSKFDEAPLEQIERWLDGSTGTISAFGSLLADDEPDMESSVAEISPFARALKGEETSEEICVSRFRDYMAANAPRRISPIRSMRSSASRKGSRDDIGAAF